MTKATTFVAGVGETVKGFTGKVAARKWALAEAIRQDVPSFRLRDMRKTDWCVYFVPAVAEKHGWDADEALREAKRIVAKATKRFRQRRT